MHHYSPEFGGWHIYQVEISCRIQQSLSKWGLSQVVTDNFGNLLASGYQQTKTILSTESNFFKIRMEDKKKMMMYQNKNMIKEEINKRRGWTRKIIDDYMHVWYRNNFTLGISLRSSHVLTKMMLFWDLVFYTFLHQMRREYGSSYKQQNIIRM